MKLLKTSLILTLALLAIIITVKAQNTDNIKKQNTGRKYIKVEVNGLVCPFCAYGLEKKLKKVVKGAADVHVFLKKGYATLNVPDDKIPSEKEIKKLVANAGFEAGQIIYSDKPFDAVGRKKNKKE